jgi:hypothetical protein
MEERTVMNVKPIQFTVVEQNGEYFLELQTPESAPVRLETTPFVSEDAALRVLARSLGYLTDGELCSDGRRDAYVQETGGDTFAVTPMNSSMRLQVTNSGPDPSFVVIDGERTDVPPKSDAIVAVPATVGRSVVVTKGPAITATIVTND